MDYFSGWCGSQRRLDGFTAIVTGSNSGIGKETAMDFYRRGARVIMACRNIQKAEDAKHEIEKESAAVQGKGLLITEHLDLCSLRSVREFSFLILERESKIQILVNNAGVMMCTESTTEDGFETHIGSNHLGHALLTLLLLPRLIASAPSRVVTVTSRFHCFYNLDFDDMNFQNTPYSPLFAYASSKVANVLFTKALALKLKAYVHLHFDINIDLAVTFIQKLILQEHNIHDVTTYSVHPGIIRSGIDRHFHKTAWLPVNIMFRNFLTSWFWKTPRCGAQTSIYCAVDEECANESGLYYSDCAPALTSKQCLDDKNAMKMWDLTFKMLKLYNYNPFSGNDPIQEFV